MANSCGAIRAVEMFLEKTMDIENGNVKSSAIKDIFKDLIHIKTFENYLQNTMLSTYDIKNINSLYLKPNVSRNLPHFQVIEGGMARITDWKKILATCPDIDAQGRRSGPPGRGTA